MWLYLFTPLLGGVLASIWNRIDKIAVQSGEEAKEDAGEVMEGINFQDD